MQLSRFFDIYRLLRMEQNKQTILFRYRTKNTEAALWVRYGKKTRTFYVKPWEQIVKEYVRAPNAHEWHLKYTY